MGEKIKAIMKEKNVSQAELAEKVGVTQAFVSYLLNGFKEPSVTVLKRIADFLEVRMDDLV